MKLELRYALQYIYILILRSSIDDFLSINNIGDYVDRIFPIKIEIKNATDIANHVSYLDIRIETDKEGR